MAVGVLMKLSKTEHRATKRTKAAPKFQSLTFDWLPFNAAMIHVTRCGFSHPWRIKPQFIFKPTCLDSAQYPCENAGTMFCHGVDHHYGLYRRTCNILNIALKEWRFRSWSSEELYTETENGS
jgi:hypothetical protein